MARAKGGPYYPEVVFEITKEQLKSLENGEDVPIAAGYMYGFSLRVNPDIDSERPVSHKCGSCGREEI